MGGVVVGSQMVVSSRIPSRRTFWRHFDRGSGFLPDALFNFSFRQPHISSDLHSAGGTHRYSGYRRHHRSVIQSAMSTMTPNTALEPTATAPRDFGRDMRLVCEIRITATRHGGRR